jgi:hypothetical protein
MKTTKKNNKLDDNDRTNILSMHMNKLSSLATNLWMNGWGLTGSDVSKAFISFANVNSDNRKKVFVALFFIYF